MTRFGRRLLHVVRPLHDRRYDYTGFCNVCGATARFTANSWMTPPQAATEWGPELVHDFALRESLFCSSCSSSRRIRRLTEVLLQHYADGQSSAADLVRAPQFRELDVAEVNAVGTLHRFLAELPRLRFSEYSAEGEDIQALSYGTGSLDLILSSDTLEHVPDWRRALGETRRVLRPGGRHIFTVPLISSRPRSADVRRRDWYHGRGGGPFRLVRKRDDYRVFTVFGCDLIEALQECGFEPELHFDDAALVLCATAV